MNSIRSTKSQKPKERNNDVHRIYLQAQLIDYHKMV